MRARLINVEWDELCAINIFTPLWHGYTYLIALFAAFPRVMMVCPLPSPWSRVMAINADKQGVRTYVSIVEAFEYPMYGLQWHPEKVTISLLCVVAVFFVILVYLHNHLCLSTYLGVGRRHRSGPWRTSLG